jgi:hypothetical protein
VRGGYGFQGYFSKVHFPSGLKRVNLFQTSQGVFIGRRFQGRWGHIKRELEFALIHPGIAGVVGMVMGDNEGIRPADIQAMPGQATFRLATAYPGIEKKPNPGDFQINTIAVAS